MLGEEEALLCVADFGCAVDKNKVANAAEFVDTAVCLSSHGDHLLRGSGRRACDNLAHFISLL